MEDFQINDQGDLNVDTAAGDFTIGVSDSQNVYDILESFQGEWKEYPAVGVGLIQYLKTENPNNAISIIKQQLQADGFQVSRVSAEVVDGNLKVSFPSGITRV